MELSAVRRDASKIDDGTWVNDIPGLEDVELKVRGFTSPVVIALKSRKERKVSRAGRERDGKLKYEEDLRITLELCHEVILLDWKGFTDHGQVIPFAKDLAAKLCMDPNTRPFADGVAYAANVVDRGYAEDLEDTVGNSPKSSRGSSQTAQPPTNS